MTTAKTLRKHAAELRANGKRTEARETETRAMMLELDAAQRVVADAEQALAVAREARAEAFANALDAGWSYSQIARATGLSHQRVGQIVGAER